MSHLNYFLDTEFYENGKTIELISIGVVCEDGREFYRVESRADETCKKSDWLIANVLPHLPPKIDWSWQTKEAIARELSEFLLPGPKPRIWTYYGAYDWVVVCQLYGAMIDLPAHFPKFDMDLKQLSVERGSPCHPKQKGIEHDALADALYNQKLYSFLGGDR